MKSMPCGCRVELNSRGEAQGFNRECPEAQRIFKRIYGPNADPDAADAELKRHIAAQR
ncbi:hypothetical protein OG742_37195 [Streptomyces sp. NBC_00828]|uniref:hypothetical protein n=1 Tax=Streptomyces sp. NBC_00828 TaxID=2903678 RepID=UPI00386443D6